MNHALGVCAYTSWSFKRVSAEMHQREMNKKQKRTMKDSKEISTTLPYLKRVSEALGLLVPQNVNVDEASHDTQDYAGASKGQADTTGECRCGVPGPLFMCVYTEKAWGERKGTQ